MDFYPAIKRRKFTLCNSMNGPGEQNISEIRQRKTNTI